MLVRRKAIVVVVVSVTTGFVIVTVMVTFVHQVFVKGIGLVLAISYGDLQLKDTRSYVIRLTGVEVKVTVLVWSVVARCSVVVGTDDLEEVP